MLKDLGVEPHLPGRLLGPGLLDLVGIYYDLPEVLHGLKRGPAPHGRLRLGILVDVVVSPPGSRSLGVVGLGEDVVFRTGRHLDFLNKSTKSVRFVLFFLAQLLRDATRLFTKPFLEKTHATFHVCFLR